MSAKPSEVNADIGSNSVEYWAELFQQAHTETVNGTLDFAQLVLECPEEIRFKAGKRARYSQPTISKLGVIGNNAIRFIRNANRCPSSWDTLYELTHLDDEAWQLALDAGDIRPDMTRNDVKKLRGFSSTPKPEPVIGKHKPKLEMCSLEDLDLDDGIVDAVITDPPYPKEYLPLYEVLAVKASSWLRDGGSLVVMTGQSWLPEVINLMRPHLSYNWTLAYLTPGQSTGGGINRAVANIQWKPVLHFTKGDPRSCAADVVSSDASQKISWGAENWGQSESGMARLVDMFSSPDELVVDPFLGSGTTGVVAIRGGRRFVGCDVDDNAVEVARARFGE